MVRHPLDSGSRRCPLHNRCRLRPLLKSFKSRLKSETRVVYKTPQYESRICIADATSGEIVRTVERWGFQVDWSRRDKFAVTWGGEPDIGIEVVDAFTGDGEWRWLGVGGPMDPAWSPDGNVLAYTSFDTGRKNWPTSITAVDPFAHDAEPRLIAKNGESPAWRP